MDDDEGIGFVCTDTSPEISVFFVLRFARSGHVIVVFCRSLAEAAILVSLGWSGFFVVRLTEVV
jgi:hypothetical protein